MINEKENNLRYCTSSMGGKNTSEGDVLGMRGRNDSKRNLLGFSEDEPMAVMTTTKESFIVDWPPKSSVEGVRRQLLRKELWDQMKKELSEELRKEEVESCSSTEYNQSYVRQGFMPGPVNTNPELHRKYPLYGDSAISLWRERFTSLPGATKAPNLRHQFRRYSVFTKPLDQALDDYLEDK